MFGLFYNNKQATTVKAASSRYLGSEIAVVTDEIKSFRAGRVRCYGGVLWSAICQEGSSILKSGQKVRILDRQGNTLIVEPIV